jgi:hypothetical protein
VKSIVEVVVEVLVELTVKLNVWIEVENCYKWSWWCSLARQKVYLRLKIILPTLNYIRSFSRYQSFTFLLG